MIDERLKQIADHYGLDEQLNMLQEECAELIQAVSKYKRTGKLGNLDEEITDVKILLKQIDYLLDQQFTGFIMHSDEAYKYWSEKKITRQLERIQNESSMGHQDS